MEQTPGKICCTGVYINIFETISDIFGIVLKFGSQTWVWKGRDSRRIEVAKVRNFKA
jgi:hypothetical protein